jgi:hypothetical protein
MNPTDKQEYAMKNVSELGLRVLDEAELKKVSGGAKTLIDAFLDAARRLAARLE